MKKIFAEFDHEGVFVYQAFKSQTVERAARAGRFVAGFNRHRTTWIKPSFSWILHRSKYATKHRMTGIAKIKLSHEGFRSILRQSVPTEFDGALYASRAEWQRALDQSEIRHQWDPDRDLRGRPRERRAIQIALRGSVIHSYVDEWTLDIVDVTELAQSLGEAVRARRTSLPKTPELSIYEVEAELSERLGADS